MAQIIKHRRGSLESLSAVTSSLQKGEIVIASGSTNLTASNGNAITFVVPTDGQVQATNRIIRGTAAPNTFPSSIYNGMVDGIPFYASASAIIPTLYLLKGGANEAIDLVGNIQPFSTSVNSRLVSVEASLGGGGSVGTRVSALEAYTASQDTKNSTLATYTGSVDTKFSTLGTYTASLETKNSTLATYTASLETKNSSLATITGSLISSASSFETRNASLATITGSLITSASNAVIANTNLNSYTSSLRAAFTASGTNIIFTNDVTIPGNLTVSGTTTVVNSTTVQLGDNIIELNGNGVANGGLYVKDPTSPNTNTGSLVWDSTNDYWKAGISGSELKLLRTGGDGVVSGSSQITLQSTTGFTSYDTALSTITGSLISTASANTIAIANLNSYTSSNSSTNALNAFSASVLTQLSTLGTYTSSLETKNSSLATITGSLISSASIDTAKFATLATYTASLETKNSTLASYTASLETKNSTLATYTASLETKNSSLATITGSLIATASLVEAKNATLATYTASLETKNSTLATYTASLETKNSSLATITGSLISSASSQNSRITVLEGTGTKQGVGTTNDVTFNSVTTAGNITVGGDLVVQGNTVTLNTATLVVEDKLISLASGSTSNATADGAGIEILGTTATILYKSAPDAWQFSKPVTGSAVTASINIPSGGGNSKRLAFRDTADNISFVTAPTTAGDLAQWDGTNFVMSNVIDGGSF